ncbi:MAG TPA: hypothetical protein ENK55_05125 [Actinobacteria bacterium]|nr:hypothetical protein [Actinomycetota bacterium]
MTVLVVVAAGCGPSADAPSPRAFAATACSENEMLVFGGIDLRGALEVPRNDGWIYSVGEGTWKPLPPPPAERLGMTAIWDGGRFVLVGAVENRGTVVHEDGSSSRDLRYTHEAAAYDPDTGRWTELSPAPIDGDGPIGLAADGTGAVVAYPTSRGFPVDNAAILTGTTWVTVPAPPERPISVVGLDAGFLAVGLETVYRLDAAASTWEPTARLPEGLTAAAEPVRTDAGVVIPGVPTLRLSLPELTVTEHPPLELDWVDAIRSDGNTVVAVDTFNGRLAVTDESVTEWSYEHIPVRGIRASSVCLVDGRVIVFGGQDQSDASTVRSTDSFWTGTVP